MIKTERNCLTGILRWPTARAKKWVQDFLTAANADKNVLAVIAVGSCVRPGVTSLDLDIVICQNAAEFFGRAPMEVDVRKFEAAHIDEEIGLANDLWDGALSLASCYSRDHTIGHSHPNDGEIECRCHQLSLRGSGPKTRSGACSN